MRFLTCLLVVILGACSEKVDIPGPLPLTREAVGNYCNMIVIDHPGPKIQIFEKGVSHALWFTSVRDGLAYNILPGEAQNILAIYVHDMGQATSWDRPEDDGIWIKAEEAFYVIGSRKRGGMGAKETIPFRERAKADQFILEYGGQLVTYDDIPSTYILGDTGEHDDADH